MGIFNFKDIFAKFGKTESSNDSDSEPQGIFRNKKLVNLIVWIILGIIVLISMGSCGNRGISNMPLIGDTIGDTHSDSGFSTGIGINIIEYRQALERDVSEALSRMEGAGKVRVTISLENTGERVLATDNTMTEERQREGVDAAGRNNYRITHEGRVVLHGRQNQGTTPIIVRENTPRISGALIVAEGAGDDRIRFELHQAARAILGAPAHRIKVVTMET